MMRRFLTILALVFSTGATALFAEGEGGVEAALVTFTDAKAGYSVGHPGTWTQDTSLVSGIRFVGGDDAMTAQVLPLPTGSNLQSFAEKDAPLLAKDVVGYKQLSLKPSKDIKGAWILGFEAQGKSSVTGKAYKAHNERYYIPLSGNRIGLVTVTGPEQHYDLEGIRDIALTLVVRK